MRPLNHDAGPHPSARPGDGTEAQSRADAVTAGGRVNVLCLVQRLRCMVARGLCRGLDGTDRRRH